MSPLRSRADPRGNTLTPLQGYLARKKTPTQVSAEAVASVLAGDPSALSLPVLDPKSKKPRTGYDKKPCLLEVRIYIHIGRAQYTLLDAQVKI